MKFLVDFCKIPGGLPWEFQKKIVGNSWINYSGNLDFFFKFLKDFLRARGEIL